MQVPLSFQSRNLVNASAPITKTFLYAPIKECATILFNYIQSYLPD